ncbi:CaiB/BaiF CoA transferase family protein [Chloroflexota bacterium]
MSEETQKLPLEAIRVIDFGQMWAGPHVTQWLAVMGAEVIKIETNLKWDQMRQAGTRRPDWRGTPNEGSAFASLNFNKKSFTINMNQSRAKELMKELVKISDVVTENFGGPVLERWGLGYSELKKLKPDIILYSGSGYGRTGPYRERPSYAEIIEAFDGSTSVNGYPGGEPNTVGVAPWTDGTQSMHGAFAILAALYHRSRTREGQYIDAAMIQASANFLGELIMDYIINGRTGERLGNRDNNMAPHGCYRCQGEYNWVVIAVSGEEEWEAFCHAIGDPDWTKLEKFGNELSRWKNQDELDVLVEEWTRQRDNYEAMQILQKAGIAAGMTLSPKDLVEDPHLKERRFFIETDHPVMGKLRFAGLPWRLNNKPRENYQYAPLLGEHNEYVLGELLGLSREEIIRLIEEKIIY